MCACVRVRMGYTMNGITYNYAYYAHTYYYAYYAYYACAYGVHYDRDSSYLLQHIFSRV